MLANTAPFKRGVIRKIDERGRLTIPHTMLDSMGFSYGKIPEFSEVWIYREFVILRMFEPQCMYCQAEEMVMNYNGRSACVPCVNKMKEYMDAGLLELAEKGKLSEEQIKMYEIDKIEHFK